MIATISTVALTIRDDDFLPVFFGKIRCDGR
jgi:hypothetical protein